jgi:predicted O-methyltransferase YrrM
MNAIILPHFGRRTAFIEMLKERGAKVGAEIGTDRGQYAKELCEGIPNLRLYCVDPYLAYIEGNKTYSQEEVNQIQDEAKERLHPYNTIFIPRISIEAVKSIEDNSLDFVFIDGNHEYKHVLEDITEWTKKVKPGGVVAGHDYIENKERKYGVIEATNQYVKENQIAPLFILHIPPHIPRRKKGNFVDCWMFFKQPGDKI